MTTSTEDPLIRFYRHSQPIKPRPKPIKSIGLNNNTSSSGSTPINLKLQIKVNMATKSTFTKKVLQDNRLRGTFMDDNPSPYCPSHFSSDSDEEEESLYQLKQKFTTKTAVDDITVSDCLGQTASLHDLLGQLKMLELGGRLTSPSRLSFALVDDEPLKRGPSTRGRSNLGQTNDRSNIKVQQPLVSLAKTDAVTQADDNDKASAKLAGDKLSQVQLKKATTKIYLGDDDNSRTVQLTSLSTPELVIKGLVESQLLSPVKRWVMVEINSMFSVERALNLWEPLLNLIEPWGQYSDNALLVREKTDDISSTHLIPNDSPFISGYCHYQIKANKWEKKFMVMKNGHIYLCKNENGERPMVLCNFETFAAYVVKVNKAKAPTQFQLAIKSQASVLMFEKPEIDYIHFFAFKDAQLLSKWMITLRYARNHKLLQTYLNTVVKPHFSPFADDSLLDTKNTIQGIEYDQNQMASLDAKKNGNFLTSDTAGAMAHRLFKLILTGDQGKTDIDKVVGTKQLPDVFAEGSLLSKARMEKEKDKIKDRNDKEEKEKEKEDVVRSFKEGSLLNKESNKNNETSPTDGGVAKESGSGPLLKIRGKDDGLFSNGSLLNKPGGKVTNQGPLQRQGTLMSRQLSQGSTISNNHPQPSLMQRSGSVPGQQFRQGPLLSMKEFNPSSPESPSNSSVGSFGEQGIRSGPLIDWSSDLNRKGSGRNGNGYSSSPTSTYRKGSLLDSSPIKVRNGYDISSSPSPTKPQQYPPFMDNTSPTKSNYRPNNRLIQMDSESEEDDIPLGRSNSNRKPSLTQPTLLSTITRTNTIKQMDKTLNLQAPPQGSLLHRANTIKPNNPGNTYRNNRPMLSQQRDPKDQASPSTLLGRQASMKTTNQPARNGPLLQLNLNKEQDHTRKVRDKAFKPLVQF